MMMNQCYKLSKNFKMFNFFKILDSEDMEENTRVKAIDVHLDGEDAIDDGGVSRELFDNICENLCSETPILPLLIPTPNQKENHGDDRECFMLNPKIAIPSSKYKESESKMLVFLGAILGHSMLMSFPHPMFLHPTFFKKLSAMHRGEMLTEMADLKAIDKFAA